MDESEPEMGELSCSIGRIGRIGRSAIVILAELALRMFSRKVQPTRNVKKTFICALLLQRDFRAGRFVRVAFDLNARVLFGLVCMCGDMKLCDAQAKRRPRHSPSEFARHHHFPLSIPLPSSLAHAHWFGLFTFAMRQDQTLRVI